MATFDVQFNVAIELPTRKSKKVILSDRMLIHRNPVESNRIGLVNAVKRFVERYFVSLDINGRRTEDQQHIRLQVHEAEYRDGAIFARVSVRPVPGSSCYLYLV